MGPEGSQCQYLYFISIFREYRKKFDVNSFKKKPVKGDKHVVKCWINDMTKLLDKFNFNRLIVKVWHLLQK